MTGAGQVAPGVVEDVQGCDLLWRGTSSELLVIGPKGGAPEGKPDEFYESFDTVALHTLEVG